MSSTENSVGSGGENSAKKEATMRAVLTIEALDMMCRGRNCAEPKVGQCSHRERAQKLVIDLASNGFTVTEIQCNLGNPLEHIDPGLWEYICTHCVEHISEHAKQACEYRKSAEKSLHTLIKLGFAVIDMFCQVNKFRKF